MPSPTREAWQKLKDAEKQHDAAEQARLVQTPDYFARGDRVLSEAKEWDALKGYQRGQREAFFVEGKQAYREVRNAIFREVRTEFREEWKDYYAARRAGVGADRLASTKADILDRQNAELETRRDAACGELRKDRDAEYVSLLVDQKQERALLAARQEQGLRSPQLLGAIYDREPGGGSVEVGSEQDREQSREKSAASFRAAADETCEPNLEADASRKREEAEPFEASASERHKVRDPANAIGDLGMGAVGAIASIGERLFDGFLGGGEKQGARPAAPSRHPMPAHQKPDAARTAEVQMKATDAQTTEAERLHAYWQERGRRRGRVDRD